MDESIKICPQCDAEYFARADTCTTCQVPLIFPTEASEGMPEAINIDWPKGPNDVLMEGPLDILLGMGSVLNTNHIPYEIMEKVVPEDQKHADHKSCESGAGGPEHAIVIPKSFMEESIKVTEAHWHKQHPEMAQAHQNETMGLCPACGADLKGSTGGDCPDCGLNLSGPLPDDQGGCC